MKKAFPLWIVAVVIVINTLTAFVVVAEAQSIGVQFVQAGPALTPTQVAGVVPQDDFNPVYVNNSAGTSGTTGDLIDANGNATDITLTHVSNDGYNTDTDTTTPDGILLHGEDKSGPAGDISRSDPGLTATYTFNNVLTGYYDLIAYIETDGAMPGAGVTANITAGSTTNYVTDEAVTGTPAFSLANNTNPNNRVTGNYVEYYNVTPSSGSITLTNTSEGGADGTAAINGFQLVPTIRTTPATQPLTACFMSSPSSNLGSLECFDTTDGLFDLPANGINKSEPTFVLTHGFNEGPSLWISPTSPLTSGFSEALLTTDKNVNIVAWNWSGNAAWDGNPIDWPADLTHADLETQNEGQALGNALLSSLGTTYSSSIHFIGHSLGTIVDAEAINTVAQDDPSVHIQDTLFDDGESANYIAGATAQICLYNSHFSAMPANTTNIPVDNYISTFGHVFPNTVNVILQQAVLDYSNLNPIAGLIAGHGYPIQWYQNTIGNTSVSLQGMGFQFNGTQAQPGVDNFLQVPPPDDEFTLGSISYADAYKYYNGGVNAIPSEVNNFLSEVTATDIVGPVVTTTGVIANLILPPDSLTNSTPALGPQFIIPKSSGSSQSPVALTSTGVVSRVSTVQLSADDSEIPSPSYVEVPIQIPLAASTISLDYLMDGLSPTDFLNIGINDETSIFSIESQFVSPDVLTNTGYLDISQWAGENVNLFIGLIPGDDDNLKGSVTVQDIEFQEVPEPAGALLGVFVSGIALLRRRHAAIP